MKLDWNRLPPQLRTVNAKRIAGTTTAGMLIALVYILVAPNWYEATLTVVPAAQSRGGGFPSQIAGALGMAVDLPGELGGNADVERIAAVLESRSVTDEMISSFHLSDRYDE